MDFILGITTRAVTQTLLSLAHNWPYLAASVLIATALPLWVKADKVAAFLRRHSRAGVVAATAAAVATPLCSCGTTAVVLGMMAGSMAWAPIVAFMVASPLTSPEGLVYSAGLFGWPFALAFYASSILLGLGAGWISMILEKRGWLANQARFQKPTSRCGCSSQAPAPDPRPSASGVLRSLTQNSGRLLAMFLGFALIGYFLNGLIPEGWVTSVFGTGRVYSVPLAAAVGLPLYINAEASLPLIRALLDAGMSQGAAMAFMIAGAGTSVGAIAGALTIARWRVVALVVAVLWLGAILAGGTFDLAHMARLV
ncbi:MAG TPA: permease [Spirochaetia bacterium]|nr:permease [Spirochaetia bacterium]